MSLNANAPIAVILAAGVGRRLGATHSGPKVLLDMGGRTLLRRRLEALAAAGVTDIRITTGFEAQALRNAVETYGFADRVTYVENPRFGEGSLLSLQVQSEALRSGRDVLVMDGDVLHDRRMIDRLLETPGEAVLLADPELEPGDEPVKVCFRGDVIVDFRKVPEHAHERHGESVGFFRFGPAAARDLADRLDEVAASNPKLEYEEAIRDLILRDPARFIAADVGDLPWTEIDFEEDVAKARRDILPQLEAV
ncbi:phosphocholine cytidylyltransferase family protein [soil metagenome]